MSLWDKIDFATPIFFGAWFVLLGFGFLPRKPNEKQQLWRKRHGLTVGVLGSCLFFFGAIFLLINLFK
jgi:hypothetical protein